MFTSLFTASIVSLVAGHGAITSITGLNGVKGTALAITDDTPRTGAGARYELHALSVYAFVLTVSGHSSRILPSFVTETLLLARLLRVEKPSSPALSIW